MLLSLLSKSPNHYGYSSDFFHIRVNFFGVLFFVLRFGVPQYSVIQCPIVELI